MMSFKEFCTELIGGISAPINEATFESRGATDHDPKFKPGMDPFKYDDSKLPDHLRKKLYNENASLREGILDFFKKKKEDEYAPLTDEHRKLIASTFKNSNVDAKTADGKHVLTHNARANSGKARFNFYNKNGKLHAGVDHYSDDRGPSDPGRSPGIS